MHPNTKKAISQTLGYKQMTKVQAQACPVSCPSSAPASSSSLLSLQVLKGP